MAGTLAVASLCAASFSGCGAVSDADVAITPALALLLPAGVQQFTAVVKNGGGGVIWSASGGSIDAGGLYTAPAEFGVFTITAVSINDSTVSGTAVALVGPVQVSVSPGGASLIHGETQQFTATVTGATLNTDVTWSATAGTIDAGGLFTAPDTAGVIIVTATSVADPTATGEAVVVVSDSRITIDPPALVLAPAATQDFTATVTGLASEAVDWSTNGGRIDPDGHYEAPATNGQFLVTATSQIEPTAFATALVVVSDVLMGVTPSGATLVPGQTQQFSATILGITDQSVTWTATDGTIDANGLFTAPDVPDGTAVTITAESVAIPTLTSEATVLVNHIGVQISPAGAVKSGGQTQQFTATVSGTANTAVTWTAPDGGTVDGTGLFTAPVASGAYSVVATSDEDPTASATATVFVPAVFVSVSPGLATTPAGGTVDFSATVFGSPNTNVTWSTSGGSISAAGVYTASAGPGTFTVTATSVADPSKSATASVIVTRTTGDAGVVINRDDGK